MPPGQTKHELWRFVFPLTGSELLAKKKKMSVFAAAVWRCKQQKAVDVFLFLDFYNKLTQTTIFSVASAAIHAVLVLKSAHASFTTPLIRMPVHGKRDLPQNKGFRRL